MNTYLSALAFLYWLNTLPTVLWMQTAACLGSWLFLIIRYGLKKKRMLLALILIVPFFSLSKPMKAEPAAGVYEVIQVKKNYAVAQMKDWKIVLYADEDLFLKDRVQVESFEEIHSRNNEGSFSFMDYMNKKGIYYQSGKNAFRLLSRTDTLSNSILKAMKSHPQKDLYLFLFYGWSLEEGAEWISSLGLPFMGFLGLVHSFLKRIGLQVHSWWISSLLILVYGTLFGWSVSLARAAIFRLARVIASKEVLALPAGIFAFAFLFPNDTASFAFVLPSVTGLARWFSIKPSDAKWPSVFLSAGLQILYFARLNPLAMILYPLLRKGFGWLFLVFGVLFFLPLEGVLNIVSEAMKTVTGMEMILWHSMAKPVFALCFLAAAAAYFLHPRKHRWLIALSLLVHPVSYRLDPFFHVYVLDVGQGDCTIVQEPFGKSTVMIDAAGNLKNDLYEKTIRPFLKSHGIRRLDALVITHDDLDHSGSREALLKDFPDCQLIDDRQTPVPVSYPFHSLLADRQSQDENDQSIVNWFSYDGFSYLWTGDASVNIEEQLLEQYPLKADILKAGHHGSHTSSSWKFLLETDPLAAVITAGFQNRYNHPSASVMKSLKELDIEALQTKELGSLHFFSWKGILFFTSQQEKSLILKTGFSK